MNRRSKLLTPRGHKRTSFVGHGGDSEAALCLSEMVPHPSIYRGGMMSAKQLLRTVLLVVFSASCALAQLNEASVTAGRAFVSTQTLHNTGLTGIGGAPYNPPLHFGNEVTVAFNYSRLLKTRGIFGIRAELPVAIYPRMDLNAAYNGIPHDIGALFVTPALRVNIFSGDSVTPWVSVGGGYGRFR